MQARPGQVPSTRSAVGGPRDSQRWDPLKERPEAGLPIPAGDPFNSRGQRPRRTPPAKSDPERVDSLGPCGNHMVHARRGATPSGSEINDHAFRGRCPRLFNCALTGLSAEVGVAPVLYRRSAALSAVGKAADLKNRSALPFFNPIFCRSWAAQRPSMLRMTVPISSSARCTMVTNPG